MRVPKKPAFYYTSDKHRDGTGILRRPHPPEEVADTEHRDAISGPKPQPRNLTPEEAEALEEEQERAAGQ
jgi:hypothetical protein